MIAIAPLKATRYIIAAILICVGVMLPRLGKKADASNRIREAYEKAEQPVLKPGSDLPEVDQFARDLRRIDMTGAPGDVRDAMAALIESVEDNATGRRRGGDTNRLNGVVVDRKRALLRALDKWRGQPY